MKVLVAGATGAIGRPLCAALSAGGHEVWGMTRSPEKAAGLERRGVRPLLADALDPAAVREAIERAAPEVVVSQLTDLPESMDEAESKLADNDRVRVEGTLNLLGAAEAVGARLIAQSIAFAYDPDGEGLASEEDPLIADAPEPFGASRDALVRMEEAVVGAGGTVLRYGFFYGPGTWFCAGGDAVSQLRKRRLPRVGGGEGVWSLLHIDDAVGATVAAVESGAVGIFNVCDDRPIPTREWIPAVAEAAGAPRPIRIPKLVARLIAGRYVVYLMCEVRGADNAKAKRELDWTPTRPDPLEGLQRIVGPS